jgi:hypothetical protein
LLEQLVAAGALAPVEVAEGVGGGFLGVLQSGPTL